jgi:CoA-transferase family III
MVQGRLLARWAASGLMALTGSPEEPLGPPAGLVDGVDRLGVRFEGLDALALLGERAALMGLWRRGSTSCGGSCRLLPSADGFVAVSLPRAEDMELVPAWLELGSAPTSVPAVWSAVAQHLLERDPQLLLERATLVGLPVARVGESNERSGITRVALGDAPPRPAPTGMLVVDLSALWAGPLCGALLAGAGAAVVKVESTQRPDGARRGPPAFYDLLNGHKRSVALDLESIDGVRALHALVQRADVVIEASRPRALAQLGLDGSAAVRAGGPQVWISITGHGRSGDDANRVAFGDDAAAAGGLVVWSGDTPLFCADAVADPLTGLAAADACLGALESGGRWLLDVSMAAVSAGLTGPTLPAPEGLVVEQPRARPVEARAPDFGADTAKVLTELGIEP